MTSSDCQMTMVALKHLLRVAVIGLGNMGRHHVKQWASLPEVSLVGVCDLNPEIAQAFSEKYTCPGFTSIGDLFSQTRPDAVSIISPTPFHFKLAQEALQAGCHVLVEKPITATVDEADQLISLAQEKNLFLTVGHIERFNPVVHAALGVIQSGRLGRVISLQTHRASPLPAQIRSDNVLMDLAVHDIDLCNVLLAQSPTRFTCHSQSVILNDRSDYAHLLLEYPKGSATIEVSWVSPIRRRGFILTGEKGFLVADSFANTLILWTDNTPHPIEILPGDALANELTHFAKAIRTQTPPWVSPQEARDVLKMVLSC